ncbi:hypothetical protein J5J10_03775 [Ciceribacter sp. L1K23]|uniref:hypothetical protein n=1 Tax=Ciceribacter sp. L1K23 TaxID=2820276 RepID=UPI001B81DBF0|nr:hypothetical protein [Ciceribacter sp. L1K23]MBR0554789.1 hypothetical protein [Ciceribacter sp. L1K23]
MTSISTTNSAALLILQQTTSTGGSAPASADVSDAMIAVANGLPDLTGSDGQGNKAEAKLSERLFSVNHQSIAAMKLDLIERTGKALGVDKDDYATANEFVSAMKAALSNIRMQPNGQQAIASIERDLGLDKLGLSINEVINSARDSEANDKVTKALEKEYGTVADHAEASELLGAPDEIGIYGPL